MRAVASAEEAAQPFRAGYDPDRGAYIGTLDGRWELNPYALVQLQHITLWPSGETAQSGFALRAAKLILHGHALSTALTFHLQVNAGDGRVVAEDVYMRWDPVSVFGLLVGQFEVPFNRQHITLEAYQEFVERSSVDARFNLARDLGTAVYLSNPDHVFEWTAGIWNGSRQNALNDDRTYLITSRIAWNPWGPILFREADLDYNLNPRLSVALAGAYNPKRVVTDASTGARTATLHIAQAVFEITLRYHGVSFSTETHVRSLTPAGARAASDYGQLIQLGVFVLPKHVELVSRLGWVGAAKGASDVTREFAAGVSWYLYRHRLKLQADYAHLANVAGTADNRVRLQLSFFL